MRCRVFDITGEYAISADSGQQIYDLIQPELVAGRGAELDFTGVKVFASAFFNFAIAQLLKDISVDQLNRSLEITELNPNGQKVLEHIIKNAKRYYSDQGYQEAVDTVIEEYAASFNS